MINRRKFIASGAVALSALPVFPEVVNAKEQDIERAAAYLDPGQKLVRDGQKAAKKGKKNNIPPVLREEISDNPRAVFIIRTSVVSERNSNGRFPEEKEQFAREGYSTAMKLFRKGTEKGGTTYIKPNFVGGFQHSLNNGVSTHPWFTAGFCDALKGMGNTNIVVGANGAMLHNHFVESGICELFHDRKICFTEGKYESWNNYKSSEIAWVDNPEGVVMRKVPFFKLTKEKDTTFINMAKDRIHQLGFTTLTIKNLQGIMPVGYMHICRSWGTLDSMEKLQPKVQVLNPAYMEKVESLYKKHADMGYKYWDDGGYSKAYFDAGGWDAYKRGDNKPGGKIFWGEQWGQRMMDIASNIQPCVNLVEGIVGIDGAGKLHLNNFITISRSMVECDSVASWLMGQDPRELPYLRIANERGMGQNDIERIAIYEITDKGIEKVRNFRMLDRGRMGVRVYGEKKNPLRFF